MINDISSKCFFQLVSVQIFTMKIVKYIYSQEAQELTIFEGMAILANILHCLTLNHLSKRSNY